MNGEAKMVIHTLTELQYSDERAFPLRLYLYDKRGRHGGGVWFGGEDLVERFGVEGAISPLDAAEALATEAFLEGREIRVTNGEDFLVLHVLAGGQVAYPRHMTFEQFWQSLEAKGE